MATTVTTRLGGIDFVLEFDDHYKPYVTLECGNDQGYAGIYSHIAYLSKDERHELIRILRMPDNDED